MTDDYTLRDRLEALLRSWDAHETNRGAPPIIDYDCYPTDEPVAPVASRLDAHTALLDVVDEATAAGNRLIAERAAAHLAYVGALLGERPPLDEYVRRTQGCPAAGWPPDYITEVGDRARAAIEQLGVSWGPRTDDDLKATEGAVDLADVPDRIRAAAEQFAPVVRALTGTDAQFELTIETVDVDAYWSYWLDGAGSQVRLRLNLRHAAFTHVRLRQFSLHEILGHGLQSASWSAIATRQPVSWVRLLSVHAPNQVLLEGLAQALPLFVAPDDEQLVARVRLDHYLQLVRGELHLAVNTGVAAADCAALARRRVPYWTDPVIADQLTDRSTDPLLRSYLWAYPAGLDWFTALADTADSDTTRKVLHAAYQRPLTPTDLAEAWPAGPPVGGPGTAVRLRQPALP